MLDPGKAATSTSRTIRARTLSATRAVCFAAVLPCRPVGRPGGENAADRRDLTAPTLSVRGDLLGDVVPKLHASIADARGAGWTSLLSGLRLATAPATVLRTIAMVSPLCGGPSRLARPEPAFGVFRSGRESVLQAFKFPPRSSVRRFRGIADPLRCATGRHASTDARRRTALTTAPNAPSGARATDGCLQTRFRSAACLADDQPARIDGLTSPSRSVDVRYAAQKRLDQVGDGSLGLPVSDQSKLSPR